MLEPASSLHWFLHNCGVSPFLIELHVIGAHDCEVFNYWRRFTQDVSNKAWSNDNRIAKWLDNPPFTKPCRVRLPERPLQDFAGVESRRTMPLVGGFPQGSPVSPPFHSGAAPYSPYFTLIGSQDLDVKRRPNNFTHIFTRIRQLHRLQRNVYKWTRIHYEINRDLQAWVHCVPVTRPPVLHREEPVSILAGVRSSFATLGNIAYVTIVLWVFSECSYFPTTLRSIAAPLETISTQIGASDLTC
ncbi:hypothetical protein PR048_022459 [Dryococelus australis]|uniref:Uncharacterized protein n=1 Tax=Dryococelus australis TaxID=614101 RepID=A0ABQ9H117_9NEOP|nr:hypothetical protein PR048_022459 [Dryococelus australis]